MHIQVSEPEGTEFGRAAADVEEEQDDGVVPCGMEGPLGGEKKRLDLVLGEGLDLVGPNERRFQILHRGSGENPFTDEELEEGAKVIVIGSDGGRSSLLPLQLGVALAPVGTLVAVADVGEETPKFGRATGGKLVLAQEPEELVEVKPPIGEGGFGELPKVAAEQPVFGEAREFRDLNGGWV